MERMRQADFARQRNVSRQAVHKLVKAGKLTVDADGFIDPVAADAQLSLLDPSRSKAAQSAPAAEPASKLRESEPRQPTAFSLVRTEREEWATKSERLDYERKAGLLIDRAGVERGLLEASRMLRDSLFSSRRRIAADLSQMTSAAAIEQFLVSEDKRLLEDFARIARANIVRAAGAN